MSFIEERLLDELSYGFSGGPTYSTRRKALKSGIERRNVNRSRPLHRFKGSFDNRDSVVVETLLSAFHATAGTAYGFRFKNHLDFEAELQALGEATGVSQEIQLVKHYSFGNQARAVPIRKPNADVVVVNQIGTVVAATVDTTTGMVTLTGTPGDELFWSGTFDLPVVFDNDEFAATIETFNATSVDIQLAEDLSA